MAKPNGKDCFVRALRRSVDVLGSQKLAGEIAGVDQATISRWLAGRIGWTPFDLPASMEKATKGEVKAAEFFT